MTTNTELKPPERIWMNPRHAELYAQPEHMRDPNDTAEYIRADHAPHSDALEVCKMLDQLDWVIGYELTQDGHTILDKALTAARAVLAAEEVK